MPIYEFQCQSCGNEVEVLQKISDAPLKDCSACGEPAMKKMVSAAAFRLSGSGWYETDFKSGDKKKNLSSNDEAKPKATDKVAEKPASKSSSSTTATASGSSN